MTKKEEMIKLRERDLSYQQIADTYHLSRQRVYQIIGKENVRRSNVQIENIVYKGIYDFMCENPKISLQLLIKFDSEMGIYETDASVFNTYGEALKAKIKWLETEVSDE